MKSAIDWIRENNGRFPSDMLTVDAATIRQIQANALLHAAQLVHDMSRGTASEARSIAIDEAADLIRDEAKMIL